MKLTDFKEGDKFKLPHWVEDDYHWIDDDGRIISQTGEPAVIWVHELESNAWEHYQEPKEERKPETWYRFEYKVEGEDPFCCIYWYKSKKEYIEDRWPRYTIMKFDIEPRVYEEREF